MVSFNDDKETQPTVTPIQVDNLHEKFQYVAEYAQDRILVGHKITSPLLFGIRTTNNGFSSQSDEMKTAYSILQTMTVQPFQNLLLNYINTALNEGGIEDLELYFEQLTPLVILSETAEETGKTIEQVEDDVNDSMATPEDTDDGIDTEVIKKTDAEELELIRTHGTNSQYFNKRFN
jgi:hypothetical protein